MRKRRHTNTKGQRQIRRGKPYKQIKHIAQKLGIPFVQQGAEVAPNCQVCGNNDNMIKHSDGQWYCHRTHRLSDVSA